MMVQWELRGLTAQVRRARGAAPVPPGCGRRPARRGGPRAAAGAQQDQGTGDRAEAEAGHVHLVRDARAGTRPPQRDRGVDELQHRPHPEDEPGRQPHGHRPDEHPYRRPRREQQVRAEHAGDGAAGPERRRDAVRDHQHVRVRGERRRSRRTAPAGRRGRASSSTRGAKASRNSRLASRWNQPACTNVRVSRVSRCRPSCSSSGIAP